MKIIKFFLYFRAVLIDATQKVNFFETFDRDDVPNLAIFTTSAQVAYYRKFHKNSKVNVARESIFINPISIYLRKNSYLTHTMDEEIMVYLSSGLIKNWVSYFADETYIRYKRMQMEPSTLKVNQINGIYELCFAVFLIGFTVFICEVLSQRSNRLKRIMDFLTY